MANIYNYIQSKYICNYNLQNICKIHNLQASIKKLLRNLLSYSFSLSINIFS
jgi:hypothetical protein